MLFYLICLFAAKNLVAAEPPREKWSAQALVAGVLSCFNCADERNPSATVKPTTPTYRLTSKLAGHPGCTIAANFTQNGQKIFSAGHDGKVVLWDANSGDPLQRRQITQELLYSAAFGSDDNQVLVGDYAGVVRLIDYQAGSVPWQGEDPGCMATTVCFGTENQLFNISTGKQVARYAINHWDPRLTKPVREFTANTYIRSMQVNAAGTQIVCGVNDGTVRIFDIGTGKPVGDFFKIPSGVRSTRYMPGNENRILIGCDNGYIYTLDRIDGSVVRRAGPFGQYTYAEPNHDGTKAVCRSNLYGGEEDGNWIQAPAICDITKTTQDNPETEVLPGVIMRASKPFSALFFNGDNFIIAGFEENDNAIRVWKKV